MASCYRDKAESCSKYYLTYDIGEIPDLKIHLVYSGDDVRVDSVVYAQEPEYKYAENFGRLIDTSHSSDRSEPYIDTTVERCFCQWENDTLYVRFKAYYGITLILHKDSFKFHMARITDCGGWQYNVDDTILTDLLLTGKYQYLKLNTKPLFQEGQQLTGYLTYTTKDYYHNNFNFRKDIPPEYRKIVTLYQTGKLYFTCRTRYMKGIHQFMIDRIKNFDR